MVTTAAAAAAAAGAHLNAILAVDAHLG